MIKKSLIGLSDDEEISEPYMKGSWPHPNGVTMIGYKRLCNIEDLVEDVLINKIEGHLIETGVWRGGACIYMKHLLKKHNSNKKIFVADSFKGLPTPDEKYFADKNDTHHQVSFLRVSVKEVRNNFLKYGLLDNRIIFIKGWFKHTLHRIKETFCIIRLDGDMYESTIDALEGLYFKLNHGGYIIIDDYFLPGCNRAVNDFREKHGIHNEMISIDEYSLYWKK